MSCTRRQPPHPLVPVSDPCLPSRYGFNGGNNFGGGGYGGGSFQSTGAYGGPGDLPSWGGGGGGGGGGGRSKKGGGKGKKGGGGGGSKKKKGSSGKDGGGPKIHGQVTNEYVVSSSCGLILAPFGHISTAITAHPPHDHVSVISSLTFVQTTLPTADLRTNHPSKH